MKLIRTLGVRLIQRVSARRPDFVIGGADRPYLLRWYLTPWRGWWRDVPEHQRTRWQRVVLWCVRKLPNAYLHQFLRSDDDRALHDHPWLFNASVLLQGSYTEHTIAAGGIHVRTELRAGAVRFRWGGAPHRVELQVIGGYDLSSEVGGGSGTWYAPCWTLFITGPVVREWGFHCPERGWVHWRDFTAADDAGAVGRGCDA